MQTAGITGETDGAMRMPASTRRDWTPSTIWTLALLGVISAFNFVDRSIFGLNLQLIKEEMVISDTMLGVISGIVFVAFYSIMGVPVARLADRYNRKKILAVGFVFWSAMTAATGFVANVWQLALTRFLMGAGESTGLAPPNSMVADLFSKANRRLGIGFYRSIAALGGIVLFPVVGWVTLHYGWRASFIAMALPALIFTPLLLFTVREPVRGAADPGGPRRMEAGTLKQAVSYLMDSRAFLCMLAGGVCMATTVHTNGAWSSAFLMRIRDLDPHEVGQIQGYLRQPMAFAGGLLGGYLADRLGRRDGRWRMWLPAIACLAVGPMEMMFLFGETDAIWMTGLALTSLFGMMQMSPIFAACLDVARPHMRATATAIFLLVGNLIGDLIGPVTIGVLNDTVFAAHGIEAIRYSMIFGAITASCAGIFFYLGGRYIVADTARAEA
jgi:MFS family permease